MDTVRILTALVAGEVCGKDIGGATRGLTADGLCELYRLSKSHDLAHLVGDALNKCGGFEKISAGADDAGRAAIIKVREKFDNQIFTAVYRYEKINYELGSLRSVLNGAGIDFIPLKGSVIRKYYPEPWMRTSCDIDILVHESEVEAAARLIVEKLGYTYEKRNYHDISLMSEGGVHLELHYSIKENTENLDALLAECWSYAEVADGHEYRFTNEFFVFHQFAHASYHFLGGGCGIRPFLDIYLLREKMIYDREALCAMLERAKIKGFSEAAVRLSEVWFGDGEHDDITRRMERFVLAGGVYGNTENSVAVGQQTERGRLGYILHRVWLPYDILCTNYPRLRGRRYLQPFYEIKRWFRIFDPKVRKNQSGKLNAIKNLSDEKKDEVNRMLSDLGMI